jgi:hypothetical protein
MYALRAVQGLQPIEQDEWDAWHHHPLKRRTLEIAQPVDYPHLAKDQAITKGNKDSWTHRMQENKR